MRADLTERPTHHELESDFYVESDPPVSISHFLHVLRKYRSVILLTVASVAVAYLIVALIFYLRAPAEVITTQPFRLDFKGSEKGEYPNKTKFNVADIINGPILSRVWEENHLGDYIPFGDFSRSVFVLESNRQYEELAAEYQAKLADPKLSPVDRERLQGEFELKAASIAKNEYSIAFDRRVGFRSVPEPLVRKVLLDILNDWADFAVNQQHVIAYQVSVLSPAILNPSASEQNNAVAAFEVLRSKIARVQDNIATIAALPGATLARTPQDHLSLEEVRIRIDDILRFRLEPLLASVLHSANLTGDRAATVRFLETQLAYDQRQLESAQRMADSIRESILVYEQPAATETTAASLRSSDANAAQPSQTKSSEAVMPQLSDTFLDRLLTMTSRSADAQFRQNLVDDYRKAIAATIPLKTAVAYDSATLDELRKPAPGPAMDAQTVQTEVTQMRAEVASLIGKVNDLFQVISRNMTPSTQLFTVTGPPATRLMRGASAEKLTLYGVVVLLVALPLTILACLLHNRVREEDAAEEYLRQERKLASAETLP